MDIQKEMEKQSIVTDSKLFKCEECKDNGWIYPGLNEKGVRCNCAYQYMQKQKNDKIKQLFSEAYVNYTFDNFEIEDDYQKTMKTKAQSFITNKGIDSILLLGQSGCGKTHLAVSIAKELLDKGAWIEMLPYPEFIRTVKAYAMDPDNYNDLMSKYRNCNYLIIDDFLKTTIKGKTVNTTDLDYVMRLIDHRYTHKKPVIVTSEYMMDVIIEADEAIAGRLREMAGSYIVQIKKDKGRNYRTRGLMEV